MKNNTLFFTVAFGKKRYFDMATALKKSFQLNNPNYEFKIFDESHITPSKEFLKGKKEIYPKDFKYAKFEVMSKLNDENINYVFIDADSFIVKDISSYLKFIKKNHLTIEYKYDGDQGWNKISKFNFVKRCEEAGIKNIKPYSLNGGFMMWRGKLHCFEETVNLIKNFDILDSKGTTGEEYYLCAGIQKSNTKVYPINYEENNFVKLWNHRFYIKNSKIFIKNYEKTFDILHYGNFNYYNFHIQKMIKNYYPDASFSLRDKTYTLLKLFKKMLFT